MIDEGWNNFKEWDAHIMPCLLSWFAHLLNVSHISHPASTTITSGISNIPIIGDWIQIQHTNRPPRYVGSYQDSSFLAF